MFNQLLQRVWNSSAPANTGKTIRLYPTNLPPTANTTPAPIESTDIATRTAKLILVTAGTNNKYYEMCENDTDTFTVHYGRVGGIRSTVTYPMAQWNKKFREKLAQGYVVSLAIEPVIDNYTLNFIRRMMGSEAHRLDAVFSVRQTATDKAFNAHVHQHTNRKTLALWYGSFAEEGYLTIYEVHVGDQLDATQEEPRHLRSATDTLKRSSFLSMFSRQGVSPQQPEFIVSNPAQCTPRYIVKINS
ncbi:hypothetical protein GCM10028805_10820 [Spirosoma harenae]